MLLTRHRKTVFRSGAAVFGFCLGTLLFSQLDAGTRMPPDPAICQGALRDSAGNMAKVAQPHDTSMQTEHDAMLALVPVAQATHTAIADGNWSNAAIWSTGVVPSANARVVIPSGRQVRFDANSSTALHWLRIDGNLRWAHQQNTQLVIDTVVVTPLGALTIGDDANPIASNVSARIRFPATSAIDAVWDPQRLSRGLLAHGATQLRGATKASFLALATPVAAGASTITLDADPHGWRVGDQLIVTGSRKRGTMWPSWAWTPDGTTGVSEDESRTISAINGRIVQLNAALQYPHAAPNEPGLRVMVANLTRNVVLETQGTPSYVTATPAQRQQRAHVMLMHEGDMRIEYAQFVELGRTDKSRLVDDPIINIDGMPGSAANPRGRYALHFHRSGARDLMGKPAFARGNSVVGSPGWGFVNHDSHVLIEDNVSFDVFGAGFVTEIGNELGSFRRNLAVLGRGSGRHIKDGGCDFGSEFCNRSDLGHGGHGFWFQGRNLAVEDNFAVSQFDVGFVYFHRQSPSPAGNGFEYVERDDLLGHPSILKANFALELDWAHPQFNRSFFYDRVPILVNRRNTAYTSGAVLHIVKSGTEQGHDDRNMFEDLLGWGTVRGVHLEYVSQYTFRRLRVYADAETSLRACGYAGIAFGSSVQRQMVFESPIVKGFSLPFFVGLHEPTNSQTTLIDPNFQNHLGGTTPGCYDNRPYPSSGILNLDASAQITTITAAQLSTAPLNYVRTQPTVLNYGGWQFPTIAVGTKNDSLGALTSESVWDNAHMLPRWVGYYRLSDNTPVAKLSEIVTDRLTGARIEHHEYVPIPANEQGSLVQFAYLGTATAVTNSAPLSQADTIAITRADVAGAESIMVSNNLLANDSDPNNDSLRVDVTWVQQPTHGKVALLANGGFVYMPNPGFTGTDQFRYRASDTRLDAAPALVTLSVTASGDQAFKDGFE
jgi:hypothetical protein